MIATEEEKPFLETEDSVIEAQETLGDRSRASRFGWLSLHGILCLFQLGLLAVNILIMRTTSTRPYSHANPHDLDLETVFSPARSAVKYVAEDLGEGYGESPFTGEPRPELDEAWSRLLRSSMLIITEDELKRMNKTSIPLKDGSGYVAYLESYHMLHCVKRFYQLQYPEHYPELVEDGSFEMHHRDHCLEVLRRGIMCNADVTLNTYFWKDDNELKGNRTGSRKCTDWSRIESWADSRSMPAAGRAELMNMLVQRDEMEVVPVS